MLPGCHQHAAGISGKLMRGYCRQQLLFEPVMAQPLVGRNETQHPAITGRQGQPLLRCFDQ